MPPRGKKAVSKSSKSEKRARSAPQEAVAENALAAEPIATPVQGHVIERPDGFYWEAKKGEPHGPFTTLAEAEADMLSDGAGDEEVEPVEGLQEAESELGINEWIDPDTGGPAEDNVPRIEDH
jgi:hypothetical protein